MELHSIVKKNEIMAFESKWIQTEDTLNGIKIGTERQNAVCPLFFLDPRSGYLK